MSTLIVLGYPSEAEAKSAYQKILDLDKNLIVSLQSVAVVARRADGKYDVVTPGSKVGTSAVWGLFWGVLFGLLFFVPIVGAALGAGIGALTGAIVKHGVDKDFQDRVRIISILCLIFFSRWISSESSYRFSSIRTLT